jgi:Glycosyltransferase
MADRETFWRTHEEMVPFYQGLDAYICASRTEGGPHPILEASACAVPVISTRVGVAPELISDEVNGILIERTMPAIREAVIRLRDRQDCGLKWESRREKSLRQNGPGTRKRKGIFLFFNLVWKELGVENGCAKPHCQC